MKAYWEYKYLRDDHYEQLECTCGKEIELHESGEAYTCTCGLTYRMRISIEVEPSDAWWYQREGK